MANGKPSTARRREVRKSLPRPGARWLLALQRKEVGWAALFIVMLVMIAGLITVWLGGATKNYPGQILTEPIIVRVGFDREDIQRTREMRETARRNQPAVYVADQAYLDLLSQRMDDLLELVKYDRLGQAPVEYQEQAQLIRGAIKALRRYVDGSLPPEQWRADTRRFLQELFKLAVLDPAGEHPKDNPIGMMPITIVHPDPVPGKQREQRLFGGRIITLTDTERLEKEVHFATRFFKGEDLRAAVVTLVMQHPQPTYRYNPRLTGLHRDEAAADVQSQIITYPPNTLLIPAGTQLSPDHLALILREAKAYRGSLTGTQSMLILIGRFGLVLLIGIAVWTYIFFYNDKIARNPMRGLAITTLLLLCQFIAMGLGRGNPQLLMAMAVLPALMAATVLVIVYDQRFALAMGGFLGLLILLSLDLDATYLLVLMAGIGVVVALLREVKSRSKLVTVGLWCGLAMGLTVLLVSVTTRPLNFPNELERIAIDAVIMVAAGLVAGLVVQGALPAIEKVFRVTTAMTLKELNDASHPLLQRLAQDAPGTYQHSLRIADMAEAAAETIGADGLFCRVGAMYHDIGKINKPMYFIENQGGGPNRHNKLTPAMSLLIIVGHVKDGIEMAREYALPPTLRHFIESHHGTTLVEYFYHAARKQTEAQDKPGPSEFEFRYPGPKPQTKEAAIMLLCDGIEGAARALPEPTPVRLDQVVNAMARKRLMDGQFDECNLTLSELHKIENSIVKTLCAVYHGRIAYPKEEKPQEPASTASTPNAAAG